VMFPTGVSYCVLDGGPDPPTLDSRILEYCRPTRENFHLAVNSFAFYYFLETVGHLSS